MNERARREGAIGSSLETAITIIAPAHHPALPHLQALLSSGDLADVLNVSQVHVKVDDSVASEFGSESDPLQWGPCTASSNDSSPAQTTFSYAAVAPVKGSTQGIRFVARHRCCRRCRCC